MKKKGERTKEDRKARKGKKWVIISVAIISVLAAGAVSAISFSSNNSNNIVQITQTEFGPLGSAHDHAAFLVIIDGKRIDFAPSKYQIKSQYIHVENLIGTTLHKHAISAPVGEFFKSVGMEIKNNCFLSDDGKQYCDSESKRLRLFVNGDERNPNSLMTYVLEDDDRFLLIYGNEDQEGISRHMEELNGLRIFKT